MTRQPLVDPHEAARILEIPPAATAEEVRAAYLRGVKEHPPDRDPEAFEKLRDAYETLRDPGRRAALLLLAGDPEAPLVSLLDDEPRVRRFVGPEPWLVALRRR
jgi:curved DNA-binding protein CbpA